MKTMKQQVINGPKARRWLEEKHPGYTFRSLEEWDRVYTSDEGNGKYAMVAIRYFKVMKK